MDHGRVNWISNDDCCCCCYCCARATKIPQQLTGRWTSSSSCNMCVDFQDTVRSCTCVLTACQPTYLSPYPCTPPIYMCWLLHTKQWRYDAILDTRKQHLLTTLTVNYGHRRNLLLGCCCLAHLLIDFCCSCYCNN